MIDSHAHIYADNFADDLDQVIERAKQQDVKAILLPNIDLESIDAMLATEKKYPDLCYSMMGVHPCHVNETIDETLVQMRAWFDKHPFVAVGEIGLDLYWDDSFFEQQKQAFITQLNWAKDLNLPVVIHTRNSMDETLAILRQEQDGRLKGVFHCFVDGIAEADAITELGFHLGIGGVATFKNAKMDEVLAHVSLDHLLLETDSPYLAPTPHRGKRNEPAFTYHVAEKIASCKHISPCEVMAHTDKNAIELFALTRLKG